MLPEQEVERGHDRVVDPGVGEHGVRGGALDGREARALGRRRLPGRAGGVLGPAVRVPSPWPPKSTSTSKENLFRNSPATSSRARRMKKRGRRAPTARCRHVRHAGAEAAGEVEVQPPLRVEPEVVVRVPEEEAAVPAGERRLLFFHDGGLGGRREHLRRRRRRRRGGRFRSRGRGGGSSAGGAASGGGAGCRSGSGSGRNRAGRGRRGSGRRRRRGGLRWALGSRLC